MPARLPIGSSQPGSSDPNFVTQSPEPSNEPSSSNTIVGWKKGSKTVTGSENVIVGYETGGNSGSQNTSVGSYALGQNEGVGNVTLGYAAGYFLDSLSDECICIGAKSGPNVTTNASGRLYIGIGLYGTLPLIGGRQRKKEGAASRTELELNAERISFFGKEGPVVQPQLAAAPTAAEIATALKNLGLITF